MSKSQISFFNNTGLKTWEIIDVSETAARKPFGPFDAL